MKDEVAVILPALDEVGSVESVANGFLAQGVRAVVVDNGSTDGTVEAARRTEAEVVIEDKRGYGNACLAGLTYLNSRPPKIVVFADCDGTLDPHELQSLIEPIETGGAGFGSRHAYSSGERCSPFAPTVRKRPRRCSVANLVRPQN